MVYKKRREVIVQFPTYRDIKGQQACFQPCVGKSKIAGLWKLQRRQGHEWMGQTGSV